MAGTTRTISLYAVHARDDEIPMVDYRRLVDWLSQTSTARSRVAVRQDLVFVIYLTRRVGDMLTITFISGDPGDVPILFNDATGQVEVNNEDPDAWPARQTRVVFDTRSRLLTIENRRAGVSATNLERYLRLLAELTGFSDHLTVDISPQPSASFEAELDRMQRIREATIIVRRPNFDWDDNEDQLAELASLSGGHRAALTVSADRGESLKRDDGIVDIIRTHVRNALSGIVNARVTGLKVGDAAESTVSIDRHVVKRVIDVPRAISPVEERDLVLDQSAELIHERIEQIELVEGTGHDTPGTPAIEA